METQPTKAETDGRSVFVDLERKGQAHAMRHMENDGSVSYTISFANNGVSSVVHLTAVDMLAIAEAITRVVRL